MENNDCIFCKIISGEIPSYKVYEDDKVLAFLDINPINPGHTLLIPKEHYENTLETPDELLQHMLATVKKITPAILQAVGVEAWNLGVNSGKESGQIVFHTHWHIMPRFESDGHQHWHGKPYQEGEAEEVTKKIKNNI